MDVALTLGLPEVWEAPLHKHGKHVSLPSGQYICMEGGTCHTLSIVLEGSVRVYKMGESGREITLYRLHPVESCILTASCILNDRLFPAFARTETAVRALSIPQPLFKQWVDEYPEWRSYVFSQVYARLQDVISLVEEVTFRKLDSRLVAYLVDRISGSDSVIVTTHEAIARDLGSSREVISRLLKEFEHAGFLALDRGEIRVLNLSAMARYPSI